MEKYANNFATALNGAITSGAVSIVVDDAAPSALHSGEFRIAVDDELMLVTAGQNTTTWTVTRGIEGTTPASHSDNAVVEHVLTAASLPGEGAWTAWTPTLTNMNLGAGTMVAKYKQIGKTVFGKITVTFGAGMTMGTRPNFTKPVTGAVPDMQPIYIGPATLHDVGTVATLGMLWDLSATQIELARFNSSFSRLDVTATTPFTWVSGDQFGGHFVYEAA